jgi:SUMO ligase MMS21 Smc5/6 complex component
MPDHCSTLTQPEDECIENKVIVLDQRMADVERRLSLLEGRVSTVVSNVVGEHMKHFAASVKQGTESMEHFQADVKDLLSGLSRTVEQAAEELNKVSVASAARKNKRRGGP